MQNFDCVKFTHVYCIYSKQVPFSVAADNSVFTVYEFLSRHLNSSTIQTDQYGVPSLALSSTSSFTPDTLHSRVSLSSASLRDNNFASTTSSSADYTDMFLQVIREGVWVSELASVGE